MKSDFPKIHLLHSLGSDLRRHDKCQFALEFIEIKKKFPEIKKCIEKKPVWSVVKILYLKHGYQLKKPKGFRNNKRKKTVNRVLTSSPFSAEP